MIRDSRRDFEFSRLNSLLSWVFSRQDKKININRIINRSVISKKYESYLNTLINELCCLFSSFLYWLFPFNWASKLKKNLSEIRDQTSINLTTVFDHGLTTLLSMFSFLMYLFIFILVNASAFILMTYKWSSKIWAWFAFGSI